MAQVIITKGLPGSGKSTWALARVAEKTGQVKRVNKDDIRAMIDGGKHSKGNEKFVLAIRDRVIYEALFTNRTVIVDDTNLNPVHEEHIRALVAAFNGDNGTRHTVEVEDFTDVPVEECISRDATRPSPVGAKIIKGMYNQYLRPTPPTIAFDPTLPTAIICDLDGTLALMNGRNPYDASTCDQDLLNEPVYRTLVSFQHLADILLVSGRTDTFRPQTEAFLETHVVPHSHLLMRAAGDSRKDWVVKQEIYDNEIKGKYNVLFILDDRNRVVDMWRENGLTVFQVAEGDF